MTNEEARDRIKQQKLEFLERWIDFGGIAEAYDMAINALEKQVPKKPNNIWRYEGRTSHCDCPICGRLTFDTSNYCHGCGQAIDWTEEGQDG